MTNIKRLSLVLGTIVGINASAVAATAQDIQFFTIATGGAGATYYPLGGVIANAISNPPGSRPCTDGGSCGVPGLVAAAQSTRGSVENVGGIQAGQFNSGFSQSDVAYWAYSGTEVFADREPMSDLRAIAALYPEHVQLVARADAGIDGIADLIGKRVSLDEPGSGTYVDASLILEAYGLSEDDLIATHLKPVPASDSIRNGELDAFFIVAGYPTAAVAELAATTDITLVPISGPEASDIVDQHAFFSSDTIPAETYRGVPETTTLAVGAQWLTSAATDEALIYAITTALWNENTRLLLDVGHAKGSLVTRETALDGLGIPLHPGAERFYRERGMIE